MLTPMRKRRILKWAGLVTCGLLLLAMVVTPWLAIGWCTTTCGGAFAGSAFIFGHGSKPSPPGWIFAGPPGWPTEYYWLPEVNRSGPGTVYIIPLWIPLALIGVPTFLSLAVRPSNPTGPPSEIGVRPHR